MGRIIPSNLSKQALSGGKNPELDTLARLKKDLSNDYTVFHGVHWSREYAKWTHFGEVDFVVVNQSGDVLVIEQKNGALDETSSGLVKQYGDSAKNVNVQIRRSVDKIKEKFQWQHGKTRRLAIDYLIYCPDYRVVKLNAAALDKERIVDSASRDGLSARIETVLGPGVKDSEGWAEKVLEFFRQTLELVPDIHAHISAQTRAFVRQVGGLADILARFEMAPLRLQITGTAGCGKSFLAREAFDRAIDNGQRPLLLCFNRSLSERLKVHVKKGGYVETFYGFCAKFLESQGKAVNFDNMKETPGFWRNVQERVMSEAIPEDWIFNTLIVDEGQDFEQEWFEIAGLFLGDSSDILWLEDPDQNIFGKPEVALDGFAGFRANANYRSPATISQFIQKTLPFEFESKNELPGLGVAVHGYENSKEQPALAARVIKALLQRGFSYDDIVILSCRGVGQSVFSERQKVGNVPLRRFMGEYDLFGNQVLSKGKLTFETVYRFKGQEAPAVILVDVDPNPEQRERANRVLYCGMTRATVRLEMLVAANNPENAQFLRD